MIKKRKSPAEKREIIEKLRAYQREHLEKLNNRKPGTYGNP